MSHHDIGRGCDIDPSLKVSPGITLVLGDHVAIGPGVRIVGEGTVKLGDYSKVHGGCFVSALYPHSTVEFGCNTWIGERTVLDGQGRLIASHNVGIGIASHLYTHIGHGDTMAGCKLLSERPLIIGTDAWFVGQCLVSPVNVGERSVAMLGSTITKDMMPNTIYAGVPARDMTDKMGVPWDDPSATQRLATFNARLREFCDLTCQKAIDVVGVTEFPSSASSDNISYFNVTSRTYTKRSSQDEVKFMSWLTSCKGRFVPETKLTSVQGA